ncbi:tetratricopeptide repeat protein [uncultured Sphingomonas sp.]|uniref:tetratricopeptide repeat protein n=1 Tax=uncultured Sphingomonas sp. TaxID=158754 RepID=UPI0037497F56
MGFVALLLLGGAAFAGMALLLRVDRVLWSMLGAALCLGGVGYAWQGRPMLAAASPQRSSSTPPIDVEETQLRDSMFGRFNADTAYLVAADAMTRSGNDDAAARVVLGGLSKLPQSFILWTWAGVTLAADAGHRVSPPALLAFRQAARLAPEHPAPPYYLGFAYLESGDLAKTRALWSRAVALSPEGTWYRIEIARRLALIDRLIAASNAR